MIESLHTALGPHYLQIKFVHLVFVSIWLWSTAVAFAYFVVPVMQNWRRNPQDTELAALRDWVFERFDQGVALEHTAFPMIIVTGLLLLVAGGWTSESSWLVLKLAIFIAIFLPLEICDYYISHVGNKRLIRDSGDEAGYQQAVLTHWWFFLLTTPAIVIFPLLVFYLAVVKPVF